MKGVYRKINQTLKIKMKNYIFISAFVICCLCGCGSNKMCMEEIGNKETEPYMCTYITEIETETEAETFN